MVMFSTPCQMEHLVHVKPQQKLFEDEWISKQKLLYGHLLLFSCLFLYLIRSVCPTSSNPKDYFTSSTCTETSYKSHLPPWDSIPPRSSIQDSKSSHPLTFNFNVFPKLMCNCHLSFHLWSESLCYAQVFQNRCPDWIWSLIVKRIDV